MAVGSLGSFMGASVIIRKARGSTLQRTSFEGLLEVYTELHILILNV
jgi:hypothetical protein